MTTTTHSPVFVIVFHSIKLKHSQQLTIILCFLLLVY